jgi:hypothetical protein
MRAVSGSRWPPAAQPESRTTLSLKVLLAVLLPPFVNNKAIKPCFRPGGAIIKANALNALDVFLDRARVLLDYLGFHKDDVFDVCASEKSKIARTFCDEAGSSASFFIAGPFLTQAHERLRLPRDGDQGPGSDEPRGFKSIFVTDEDTAADRAINS